MFLKIFNEGCTMMSLGVCMIAAELTARTGKTYL